MSLVRSEEAKLMTFCYQGVFLGAFSKAHSCIMYNCCVYKACSNRGTVVVLQTIYSALCSLLENKKVLLDFLTQTVWIYFRIAPRSLLIIKDYILDVLWGQPIKLIQVVSTSEFHEYWWNDLDFISFVTSTCCRALEVRT